MKTALILTVLVVSVLASGTAMAADSTPFWSAVVNTATLANHEYDQCNLQFLKNVAQSVETRGNVTGLVNQSAALDNDITVLKGLSADPANVGQYVSYRNTQGKQHAAAFVLAIKNAILPLNGSTKLLITSDTQGYVTTLDTCYASIIRDLIAKRVQFYNAVLDAADADATSLEAKGANVTEMRQVIADGRAWVTSFSQGAANLNSTLALKAYYLSKCFGNGCYTLAQGTQLDNNHFYAKYTAAKLDAITNLLEPYANAKGREADIASIRLSINDFKSQLNQADKFLYTEAQVKGLWTSLVETGVKLKLLWGRLQ